MSRDLGKYQHVSQTDDAHPEVDLGRLRVMIDHCLWLSFANLLPSFALYVLCYVNLKAVVYVLLVVKLLAFAVWQHTFLQKLSGWIEALTRQGVLLEHSNALKGFSKPKFSFIFLSKEAVALLAGLYETIDPDMDVLTAASSWTSITAVEEDHFGKSLQLVPWISKISMYITLPGILTFLVCFATVVQLYAVTRIYGALKNTLQNLFDKSGLEDSSRRWILWTQLAHLTDVAGFMLLKDVFQDLVRVEIASGNPHVWPIVDRVASFQAKIICEVLPSLWFQVSLLALTQGTASMQSLILNLASIFTGTLTTVVQMHPVCETIRENCRRVKRPDFCWRQFVRNIICAIFTVVWLIVCLIRLAGVWTCSSHVLNLSTGCLQ